MLELIDDSKTYELVHPSGAVFIMKHWTVAMQEEVEKKCIKKGEKDDYIYDIALERVIKIDLALHDWRGIQMSGEDAPCTPENKRKLPVGVVVWILKDINERAGINIPDSEKKS